MTPRKLEPLTKERILATALVIVDSEGLDALTMRHLAHETGVEAMTLYHHFPNKDAILDGVVETVMGEMSLPDPMPEAWMELIEAMLLAFRGALARHPSTIPILVARPMNTAGSSAYVEAPLRVMQGAGFSPEQTAEMYQGVLAFTFGHALIAGTPPQPAATSPLKRDDAAEEFPATVALGPEARSWNEAGFRRGARLLLEGYARTFE
jgi:AcrR family transcriptional regulator